MKVLHELRILNRKGACLKNVDRSEAYVPRYLETTNDFAGCGLVAVVMAEEDPPALLLPVDAIGAEVLPGLIEMLLSLLHFLNWESLLMITIPVPCEPPESRTE